MKKNTTKEIKCPNCGAVFADPDAEMHYGDITSKHCIKCDTAFGVRRTKSMYVCYTSPHFISYRERQAKQDSLSPKERLAKAREKAYGSGETFDASKMRRSYGESLTDYMNRKSYCEMAGKFIPYREFKELLLKPDTDTRIDRLAEDVDGNLTDVRNSVTNLSERVSKNARTTNENFAKVKQRLEALENAPDITKLVKDIDARFGELERQLLELNNKPSFGDCLSQSEKALRQAMKVRDFALNYCGHPRPLQIHDELLFEVEPDSLLTKYHRHVETLGIRVYEFASHLERAELEAIGHKELIARAEKNIAFFTVCPSYKIPYNSRTYHIARQKKLLEKAETGLAGVNQRIEFYTEQIDGLKKRIEKYEKLIEQRDEARFLAFNAEYLPHICMTIDFDKAKKGVYKEYVERKGLVDYEKCYKDGESYGHSKGYHEGFKRGYRHRIEKEDNASLVKRTRYAVTGRLDLE